MKDRGEPNLVHQSSRALSVHSGVFMVMDRAMPTVIIKYQYHVFLVVCAFGHLDAIELDKLVGFVTV